VGTQAFQTSAPVSTAPSQSTTYPNQLGRLVSFGSSGTSLSTLYANLPGTDGIVVPFSSSPANVKATYGSLTQQATVTPSSVSSPTLQSLQIAPRNLLFGEGSSPPKPASGSTQLFCTGFFANGTVGSLASNVTWSVSGAPTGSSAVITADAAGATLQLATAAAVQPAPFNLTLTASYQGKSDSTTFQVLPPLAGP
jgi:hypothetical protein